VHGDPRLIPFERSFPLASQIAERIRHTGYVVSTRPSDDATTGAQEVLVSAGGGAVGRDLLVTALHARAFTHLKNRVWRVIVGVSAQPSDAAMIKALGDDMGDGQVVVERMRSDFTTLLANCAVSVSQGGYNTIMEILATRARAVVVPFAAGAETEQMLRACALAERGCLQLVPESELNARALAAAIDRAAFGPAPPPATLDLDGAAASARILHQHLAARGQ